MQQKHPFALGTTSRLSSAPTLMLKKEPGASHTHEPFLKAANL